MFESGMTHREQSDCESGLNSPLSWEITADQLPLLASEDLGLYWNDMPDLQQDAVEAAAALPIPTTTCADHDVGDWPGNYGFRIFIEDKEKSKNASWTYSATQRKLYVSMGHATPIYFVTDRPPPENATVCVVAVFVNADLRHRTVRRCPVHAAETHETNVGHRFPDHWVRCDHPSTLYFTDEANGQRQCLSVPFEAPASGDALFTYTFKFMCNNSCVGGPGRQATAVFFILQSHTGEDLGRCVIEVKVCACPHRDRLRDETLRKRSRSPRKKSADDVKNEKKKLYSVQVKDKKTYELLSQVRDVLEIRESYLKKVAKRQAKADCEDSE